MSPFTWWTDVAFKLWGLGRPTAQEASVEKPVAVAVIPAVDAPPKDAPSKAAQAQSVSKPKRASSKARGKPKSKSKAKSRSRR